MKVSDLCGVLLDYWTAKAGGYEVILANGMAQILTHRDEREEVFTRFNPSSDWRLGGPILERNRIYAGDKHGVSSEPGPEHWCCYKTVHEPEYKVHEYWGATMLEAGLRVRVAMAFGDTVCCADDEHEWKARDESFDHEYGTQQVHFYECELCGATRHPEPGDDCHD